VRGDFAIEKSRAGTLHETQQANRLKETTMQIGELILASMKTRTAWFDRPADNAMFTYEIISDPDSVGITVKVLHKNYEDTGNGADAVVSWNTTGAFRTGSISGLKEQVRFEIEGGVPISGSPGVLYRILAPTWFNKADT
jgi:hypothetical protein